MRLILAKLVQLIFVENAKKTLRSVKLAMKGMV